MKRTIYRDASTGRFVSGMTWKRSRSHGGTRYKRQSIKMPSRARVPARQGGVSGLYDSYFTPDKSIASGSSAPDRPRREVEAEEELDEAADMDYNYWDFGDEDLY